MANILSIAFLAATIIVIVTMLAHAIRYAPFVPTPYPIVKKMIEAARLMKNERVVDLGAGDGRITILAEKKGAHATGFELALIPFVLAKLNIFLQKSEAKIVKKNFFKTSLVGTDCVFCYLWPRLMNDLKKKFEAELKEGARIISYSFPIKDWTPTEKIPTQEGNEKSFLIYVYEMGKSNKHA